VVRTEIGVAEEAGRVQAGTGDEGWGTGAADKRFALSDVTKSNPIVGLNAFSEQTHKCLRGVNGVPPSPFP
jgi:hypothetical protein